MVDGGRGWGIEEPIVPGWCMASICRNSRKMKQKEDGNCARKGKKRKKRMFTKLDKSTINEKKINKLS